MNRNLFLHVTFYSNPPLVKFMDIGTSEELCFLEVEIREAKHRDDVAVRFLLIVVWSRYHYQLNLRFFFYMGVQIGK